MKAKAIVDTSFWIHLVKINLEDKFLELYDIIVPTKVEEEILFCNTFKFMIYKPKDIKVYEKLKSLNKIENINPCVIPKELSSQISKNSGELYAISLSKEKDVIVFIDNGRPYDFCIKNKIKTGTIIDFLVYLKEENQLNLSEIKEKIKILENSISKKLLKDIKKYINM
jgi:hypothetical protein